MLSIYILIQNKMKLFIALASFIELLGICFLWIGYVFESPIDNGFFAVICWGAVVSCFAVFNTIK